MPVLLFAAIQQVKLSVPSFSLQISSLDGNKETFDTNLLPLFETRHSASILPAMKQLLHLFHFVGVARSTNLRT